MTFKYFKQRYKIKTICKECKKRISTIISVDITEANCFTPLFCPHCSSPMVIKPKDHQVLLEVK